MISTEIEGKLLNISILDISANLLRVGASFQGEKCFKRYIFDTLPARKNSWVRLRTDGQVSTLTFKEIIDNSISGTNEWEVTVSDFDTTKSILISAGFMLRSYQENYRLLFLYDKAEITIDFWPKLKPYVEIEASSVAEVYRIVSLLGFNKEHIVTLNTQELYTGIGVNLRKTKTLKFTLRPKGLDQCMKIIKEQRA